MYVHLKQSGELLTRPDADTPWTAPEVALASERIAEVRAHADELGIRGLMVVSGAGNIIRGVGLRKEFEPDSAVQRIADAVGRLGTVQNAIVLSAGLNDLAIPNRVLVAETMDIVDPVLARSVSPYSERTKQQAYDRGEVVLIAGGDGRDGHTTDAAVLAYAQHSAAVRGEVDHRVLKATQYNGVYDGDPRIRDDVVRYDQISAGHMLTDYDRFRAVDRECLDGLVGAPDNLSLQIYAAGEFTPLEALRSPDVVGTLVVPGYAEPVLASF